MIVAVVVPPLDSQSFEKTSHAFSFPGVPETDGHEEGNISMLLQLYDSLGLVFLPLLASQTLPPKETPVFEFTRLRENSAVG